MAIARDIHELLYRHDCVVVPGFGGFLTHYRPARVDEARGLVLPPAKDISFNKDLVRNDGLLADRVARRANTDFDGANALIEADVVSWRRTLAERGRMELPQVGVLFRDGAGNLRFEPDPHANHLRDAFGLRPIAARPVKREATPVIPMDTSPLREQDRRTNWMWAAAAASAIVFGASAWFLTIGRTGGPESAGIWSTKEVPTYTERSGGIPSLDEEGALEDLALTEGSGVRELDLGDGRSLYVDLGAPIDSTHVEVPVPGPINGRYHVIAGCFAEQENAERLVGRLKERGFAAHVVDTHGGLHRVAFGTFPQRQAALEALAAVRRHDAPDAWLLIQ